MARAVGQEGVIERMLAARAQWPVESLDEWGGEGLSEFVEKALTLAIDRRQKAQVPTIITLNLAADVANDVATEQLVEMFGPSLADRLRERAQFWPIWGKSKRSTLRVLPFEPRK